MSDQNERLKAKEIVDFMAAVKDRYDERREIWGEEIASVSEAYEANKRKHNFSDSWEMALTDAIERILAAPPKPSL